MIDFSRELWLRKNKYVWELHGYVISHALVQSKNRFTAWPPEANRDNGFRFIGTYNSAENARIACLDHYKNARDDTTLSSSE